MSSYNEHEQMREKKKLKMSDSSSNNNDGGAPDEVENQTSKPSPSTTLPSGQSHEVFLSFRGEDTRYGFTDHLYRRLEDAGISVFRDNEGLRVGETIASELDRAIEGSKISIPIISSNYGSSKWCLNELVQILKCMKASGQCVLPIFYRVKPSDVRHQKGGFGRAFERHIKKHNFDGKLVQEWKNAFAEVSSLKGWELVANSPEGELVKMVCTEVFNELGKAILIVPDPLVGIEDPVENIMGKIKAKPMDEVKIIGISGMGGIGKTTLAKVIYNKLSDNFEYRSFVPDIRERSFRGMESLQKQVISDILMDKSLKDISNVDEGINMIKRSCKGKKLLLLLDDVEKRDQLNKLAADPSWFGPQSIIIITTRNQEVIKGLESSLHYELNELNSDQSFQLFCKRAFRKDEPPSVELETVAKDIVHTTGGLPLAIEVIGSSLFQKNKEFWEATSKKLKTSPNGDILDKLRISYEALRYEQQQLFLDIAFIFSENWSEYAFYMWDDCGCNPKQGIDVLVSRCLIKIGGDGRLIMHDQLKDLGREIVRSESYEELGKRSRLWITDEAVEVIQQKQDMEKVQVLRIDGSLEDDDNPELTDEHFKKLNNLRFLCINSITVVGDFKNSLSELRWLQLFGYRRFIDLEEFMATFHFKKLVNLEISCCQLESWGHIKLASKLKALELFECSGITETPDFSALRELEILRLRFCWDLREIDASIGHLNKKLKILDVSGCCKIEELPRGVGKMEELKELLIDCTSITSIPIFEGFMTKLETLSAFKCIELEHIPDCIGMLTNLQALNLDRCQKLKSLPPNLPRNLTSLMFHGDSMETLPNISDLTKLKDLKYSDAFEKRDRALNLTKLNKLNSLHIAHSMEWDDGYLPLGEDLKSSKKHPHLEVFEDIHLLLEITSSLVILNVHGCQTLRQLPNMLDFKRLSKLRLVDCCGLRDIGSLEGAKSLTCLQILGCKNLSKLSGLGVSLTEVCLEACPLLKSLHLATAKNLKELRIRSCGNLVEISGVDVIEGLQYLEISSCSSLEGIGDLSILKMLKTLKLSKCKKLSVFEGYKLSSLGISVTKLWLKSCPTLKSLHLATAKNLKKLRIQSCDNLVEICGLDGIEGLQYLEISYCSSLERIGDLSNLKMLKTKKLSKCEKLNIDEGIDESEDGSFDDSEDDSSDDSGDDCSDDSGDDC